MSTTQQPDRLAAQALATANAAKSKASASVFWSGLATPLLLLACVIWRDHWQALAVGALIAFLIGLQYQVSAVAKLIRVQRIDSALLCRDLADVCVAMKDFVDSTVRALQALSGKRDWTDPLVTQREVERALQAELAVRDALKNLQRGDDADA